MSDAQGTFSSSEFDPVLITAQMIAQQLLFYGTLTPSLMTFRFVTSSFSTPLTLSAIFDPSLCRSAFGGAVTVAISYIIAGFFCSASIAHLVQKPKKCWDFAVSLVLIHITLSLLVSRSFGILIDTKWILTLLAFTGFYTLLGMHLSLRRALKAIPINTRRHENEETKTTTTDQNQ